MGVRRLAVMDKGAKTERRFFRMSVIVLFQGFFDNRDKESMLSYSLTPHSSVLARSRHCVEVGGCKKGKKEGEGKKSGPFVASDVLLIL